MRKILTLFFAALFSVSMFADREGGTVSSEPDPINPSLDAVITYNGAGTNFAAWQPSCFIYAWLIADDGLSFSKAYEDSWINCASDADYTNNVPAERKMAYAGVAEAHDGTYTITINIKDYFDVEDEDLDKIAKIGIIVCTQYNNQGDDANKNKNMTKEMYLSVNRAYVYTPTIKLHGTFTSGWADTDEFTRSYPTKATASLTIKNLAAGTYSFGTKSDDIWKANSAAITRANNSTDLDEGTSGEMSLNADIAGDYTFTWTYASNVLTVTYPDNGGGTGVDDTVVEGKAVKRMENGQLVIIKNGVKYNALGTEVK